MADDSKLEISAEEHSRLLSIEARYERAVHMATEFGCTCNTAREPAEVARDLCSFLTEGRRISVPRELRLSYCQYHSSPLPEFLEKRKAARRLAGMEELP